MCGTELLSLRIQSYSMLRLPRRFPSKGHLLIQRLRVSFLSYLQVQNSKTVLSLFLGIQIRIETKSVESLFRHKLFINLVENPVVLGRFCGSNVGSTTENGIIDIRRHTYTLRAGLTRKLCQAQCITQ